MPKVDGLTAKQQLWLDRYLVTLNATESARGVYDTEDYSTLSSIGWENMRKPEIRAVIDRVLAERAMSAPELIARVSDTAAMDVGPYLREDGTLDLVRMRAEGKTRWIKDLIPGRAGLHVALQDPQAAQKLLARYHQLLSDHVDVDVHGDVSLDVDTLDALAGQIAVAKSTAGDTEDSDSAQDDTG